VKFATFVAPPHTPLTAAHCHPPLSACWLARSRGSRSSAPANHVGRISRIIRIQRPWFRRSPLV